MVDDPTPPVFVCPSSPSPVECIGDLEVAYTTLAEFIAAGGSASDNCGLDVPTFMLVSETDNAQNCPRIITRTYSIADSCGNVSQCVQTLTVDDPTPPVFVCPSSPSPVECIGDLEVAYTTLAEFIAAGGSASDNCGLDVPTFMLVSETDNAQNCPRIITRTYSIADSCGNVSQCVQTLTVDDPNTTGVRVSVLAIAGRMYR